VGDELSQVFSKIKEGAVIFHVRKLESCRAGRQWRELSIL